MAIITMLIMIAILVFTRRTRNNTFVKFLKHEKTLHPTAGQTLYIYIYIYMCTYIQTYIQTGRQTDRQTYIHIHTFIHTYIHTCMHACMHI